VKLPHGYREVNARSLTFFWTAISSETQIAHRVAILSPVGVSTLRPAKPAKRVVASSPPAIDFANQFASNYFCPSRISNFLRWRRPQRCGDPICKPARTRVWLAVRSELHIESPSIKWDRPTEGLKRRRPQKGALGPAISLEHSTNPRSQYPSEVGSISTERRASDSDWRHVAACQMNSLKALCARTLRGGKIFGGTKLGPASSNLPVAM